MNWTIPTGLDPLLWIVLFLLFGPPMLLSKAGAKMPGFLGWAGRKWQAHGIEPDRKSIASYQVSQSEIRRVVDDYTRLNTDYGELAERVDRIEEELSREKRIRWAAIGYIRQLIDALRKHAPGAEVPPAPPLLSDIL